MTDGAWPATLTMAHWLIRNGAADRARRFGATPVHRPRQRNFTPGAWFDVARLRLTSVGSGHRSELHWMHGHIRSAEIVTQAAERIDERAAAVAAIRPTLAPLLSRYGRTTHLAPRTSHHSQSVPVNLPRRNRKLYQ